MLRLPVSKSPRHPWARVLRLRYFGTLTRKMVLEVKGALAMQKAPMDSHGNILLLEDTDEGHVSLKVPLC